MALCAAPALACPTPEALATGLRISYDDSSYQEVRTAEGGVDTTIRFALSDITIQAHFADGIYGTSFGTAETGVTVTWSYSPDFSTAPPPASGTRWTTIATEMGHQAPDMDALSSYTWIGSGAPLVIGDCVFEQLTLVQSTTLADIPHVTRYAYLPDFGILVILAQTYGDDVQFDAQPIAVEELE